MKKKLWLLELNNYYYYDEIDQEHVEDRFIIGYFLDRKNLNEAISLCERQKSIDEKIMITEFDFECSHNQKYVYVLFYEYSILKDGEYSDYYEYFEPQSSYKKCINQKEKLLNIRKYQIRDNRIFDDSKDGFRIDKIKIDYISHINYH